MIGALGRVDVRIAAGLASQSSRFIVRLGVRKRLACESS